MNRHNFPQSQTRAFPARKSGFALIVVLALLVLVTALIVAFYSRSASRLNVSAASAASSASRELAKTALETITDDLRAEIVAGSKTPADTKHPVYIPKEPVNAAPVRVGTTESMPNLIKRSAYNLAFDKGTGENIAANVSTGTAALNGRNLSAARWNAHRLLETDAGWDSPPAPTPSTGFVLPDWIYLTSNGTHPTTLDDANKSTGNNPILGRFAYAIYNEGGLLDINYAGSPSGVPAADSNRKGFLAFADLSELKLSTDDMKKIFQWRNAGTGADPLTFAKKLHAEPSGFLNVPEGDRSFISRTQLLRFFEANSIDPAPLRFLGTFTRGLNQPTFGGAGPAIPGSPAPKPTIGTGWAYSLSGYTGNNDAAGSEDKINPVLMNVRVTAPFTRFEPMRGTGSTSSAKSGDPLIAKRFPLDRLAWLTYKGPIASDTGVLRSDVGPILASLRDAGFSDEFLKLGTAENIKKAFGLEWQADPAGTGHNVWVYTAHFSDKGRIIGRLEDVATSGRDPNFFELLKAGINVGSLGKAAASDIHSGLWIHAHDIRVDFHVLQLAANIIDQFDSDGYPVEIALPLAFSTTDLLGLYQRKVRGVENLPYLYRLRSGAIMIKQSDPQVPKDVSEKNGYDTPPLPLNSPDEMSSADSGLGAMMLFHTIWNPHDPAASLGTVRPTQFRVICWSGGPDAESSSALPVYRELSHKLWVTNSASWTFHYGGTETKPYLLSRVSSELLFDIPGPGFFSEPTALVFPGVPSGSNLRAGSGNEIRNVVSNSVALGSGGALANLGDNNRQYVGALVATFPLRAIWKDHYTDDKDYDPVKNPTTDCKLITASYVDLKYSSALNGQLLTTTSVLEYYDDTNWVPYDIKTSTSGVATSWFFPNNIPQNPMQPGVVGISRLHVWTDPRTERFGSPWWQSTVDAFLPLDTANASLHSMRPDASIEQTLGRFGNSSPGCYYSSVPIPLTSIGWVGTGTGSMSNDSTGHFYPQALAENDATNGLNAYYDPDGVARGGMSIYSPARSLIGKPQATGASSSRPVFLNRPYRSVAELGYVFRDLPWKQIDFFTKESGDAALLDLFCIKEDTSTNGVVAGKVDLNTRNPEVLQAVLKGVAKDEFALNDNLTSTDANYIAKNLVKWTSGNGTSGGPFRDTSELVNRYDGSYSSWLSQELFSANTGTDDNILAKRREAPLRALADVGEARVWNLFIDIVAQAGFCGPNASKLDNFTLKGETRIWAHLAIDRATGKVIDRQIEYVTK